MEEPAGLAKKLQVKSGTRLRLINVPVKISNALAESGIQAVKGRGAFDGAIAFCETPSDVAKYSTEIFAALPEDGLLWFAYRKGDAAKKSGLSRDVGWDALQAHGYRAVRSIAFDNEWTGLRFRPISKVKARGG